MKQNKYLVTGDDISTMGLTLLPGKEELSGKKILTCGEILDTYQVEIASITDSKRCVPYERIAASVYLDLSASTLFFTAAGGTKTITIDTNIAEDSLSINTISGFTVTRVGKSITIVADNLGTTPTSAKSSELIVSGGGLTASCIISQSENTIASLKITSSGGNPDTEFPTSFSAGGATYTAASYAYYSSGSHKELTDTSIDNWSISGDGFSIEANVNFSYCVNVTASNRYDVDGAEREAILSITYSDKTFSLKLLQEANLINYGEVTLSGGSVPDIPAWGGQVDAATELVGDQTISYTSGSIRPGNVTIQYSDPVSSPSLGTNEYNRRQVGILTATGLGEGSKSATKEFPIFQQENKVEDVQYDMPYISSFTVNDIPASGGTISSGNVQYYQNRRQYYTSKETKELSPLTTGADIKYTDPVIANSLANITKERSKVGELTVYVTLNEERGEKTVDVYQEANKETVSKELVLILANTPGISVDNPLPASGGKIQYNAYCKVTNTFTSGYKEDSEIPSAVAISGDGFTVDLNEGAAAKFITAENRGSNLGDARRATLSTSFETLPEKSVYIYQAANEEIFGEVTFTTEGIVGDIPASGGTIDAVTDLDAAQTITYSSGFSLPGTVSISYSDPITKGSLGTITISRTKVGQLTTTATGEGGKQAIKKYDIYQEANSIEDTIYDSPYISLFTVDDVPASGGTISSGNVAYKQSWRQYYTSKETKEMTPITSGGKISYSDPVSASSLLDIKADRSIIGKLTVYVELNSERGEKTIDVYQEANKESFGEVIFADGGTVSDIPASGGTIDSVTELTASQTVTYTSGSTRRVDAIISYSTPVTAKSKGNSISNRTSVGTLTATATGEGSKVATKQFTVYQVGNYVTKIELSGGSLSYPTIEAGATSATPTAKGMDLMYTFTSGTKSSPTPSSTFGTYSASTSYSLGSVINGFTAVNSSSGVLTATNRGSTIGDARTSGIVTRTVKATWTPTAEYNTGGTITGTGKLTATCTQKANILESIAIRGTGDKPVVTEYPASGATYSLALRATYSSGAYPEVTSIRLSNWILSGEGFTITESPTYPHIVRLKATSRTTVAGPEWTGILKITYSGKTAEVTVTQEANIATYGEVTITGGIVYDIPASGGTEDVITELAASQVISYTSGSTQNSEEVTISYSDPVTASSLKNVITSRKQVGTLTAIAIGKGNKIATKDFAIYQQANSVTYGDVSISGGTVSDIPAAGGSISATGCTAAQHLTYTSTYEEDKDIINISATSVSAPSKGTEISSRTVIGNSVVTATGEGSKKATKSFTVYQQENSVVSASNFIFSSEEFEVPADYPAEPVNTSCESATADMTYTSGATETGYILTGIRPRSGDTFFSVSEMQAGLGMTTFTLASTSENTSGSSRYGFLEGYVYDTGEVINSEMHRVVQPTKVISIGTLLLTTIIGSFPATTFYIQFQIQGTDLATTLGTVDTASGTISIPQNIVESVVEQAYGAPFEVDIKLHQGTTPGPTPTMTGMLTQQQMNELKLGKGITIIVG